LTCNQIREGDAMKIVIIILIVLAVLILALFIAVKIGMKLPGKVYDCPEEMLQAKADDGKKAFIVYQPSVTKASDEVAHAIAQGLNDSGYEVILNCPSPQLSADISGYSVVVFGSPIYGGQPATTLTDYMQRIGDFSQVRSILFVTAGFDQQAKEFDKMKEILGSTEPAMTKKFQFSQKEANRIAAYQMGLDAAVKP
jgi:menaquinone-dependent protoporphyrinogen IX oxidase